MENGRKLSRLVLVCAAGLLMGVASEPQPLAADAASLEVVPRVKPFDVSLTRGEPATVTLDVRNPGEAKVEVGTLHLCFGTSEPCANPTTPSPSLVYPKGVTLEKGQVTSVGIVFPAYEAVGDYRGELYLTGPQPGDQRKLLLSIPIRVNEMKGPTLSRAIAGWVAVALAALVLLLPLVFVDKKQGRGHRRRSFFITPIGEGGGEAPRYSISRFQVWLWTAVILSSYTFIFFTKGAIVAIPSTLIGLMGISVGSIVTATSIAVRKKDQNRDPGSPASSASGSTPDEQNWLASMLSENGSPSAMRLQMFAWTIAMTVFFVWQAVTTATLWDIPPSLLALMGVSHGGYLIDKGVGNGNPPAAGERGSQANAGAAVGAGGRAA